MKFEQIFETDSIDPILARISVECKTFLRDSGDRPVFKTLPETYEDLRKVKVRKHKHKNKFSETFNEAFEHQVRDLRQRAVFANSLEYSEEGKDLFYIFPKDGYKFMYSSEVKHSSRDYQQVFDSLFEQFDEEKAELLIHDLLKFTYSSSNLIEGIDSEAEIIFYNIPYYYAARVTAFDYHDLLSEIKQVHYTLCK